MAKTPSINLQFSASANAAADWLEADELYDNIRTRRVIAFIIDVIIVAALTVALWMFGSLFVVITLGAMLPLLALAASLLPLAYHTLLIGGAGHATVGMRVMGIRVACWDGSAPGYMQAAIQTVLFYLSIGVTSFLVLLLALLNDRGRCLHDFLSGCVVINDLRVVTIERDGAGRDVSGRSGSDVASR